VIVVDTNVLAYLLIPGKYTDSAETLLVADANWAAPRLWRSELRKVLSTYIRTKRMTLSDAVALYRRAADVIGTDEYDVEAFDVLRLSEDSGCSAYDCEFVALAEFLDVRFVTADAKLVKAFAKRGLMLS
jgi:predicted nucleic acid-binding protein